MYGFSEQYYRAFGYETAGRNTKLTVDSARLPRFAQDLDVRLLGAGDVEAIRDCHTAFARRHSGSILRNDFQWERVLSPKNHRSLYVAGDPAEAYAVIQHRDAFWETQWVEEIVWNTKRGYDSILAVLKGVAINKSALSWFEPSNSLYLAHYYDHGCNVEVERTAMFRVLHVPNALKALKPESTGEFTIRVLDGEFPENEGPWQVRFDANGVSVEKASSAGLCLDVRHFAQAFLGEPSLRDLINLDLVEVSDDADAVAAERLLTPSCTHCADFF